MSEEHTTGSSIMPQKMNPDVAEKIRGKSSKLIANLNHVLIAMKGTSSGYNRDSAESKVAIMASLGETLSTLTIAHDLFETISINPTAMKQGVVTSLSTKLADELVKKFHFSFRTAHKIVGRIISSTQGKIEEITCKSIESTITEIAGKEVTVNKIFIDKVYNIENALMQYQYEGAAGPKYVAKVNMILDKQISSLNIWIKEIKKKFIKAELDLFTVVYDFIKANSSSTG